MLLHGFVFAEGLYYTRPVDPNLSVFDPNLPDVKSFFAHAEPNSPAISEPDSIPGTLAMNWLYQGKKPPAPLVGQDNVSFRTEVYPWPYIIDYRDNYFTRPWFYDPWYRYGYWRHYGYDYWRYYRTNPWWWRRDAFTYPLNYVGVEMKLNTSMSFSLGAYFLSDPLYWP